MERPDTLAAGAGELGYTYEPDPPVELAPEIVRLVPEPIARDYQVIPWRLDGQCLVVLTADPENEQLAAELTFILDREVRLVVCDPDKLAALLLRHHGEGKSGRKTGAGNLETGEPGGPAAQPSAQELATIAAQAPIIQFVNQVLTQAIHDRASDIHFEPFEAELRIRCRIDGVLYAQAPPPRTLALPIASRLKVLANLDIAERRLPQDGRIRITLEGRAVDLRVSTMPTQFGESVVLRVLDQTAVQLDLDGLGLPAGVRTGVQRVIHRPNGIFLVTGPTGSGKTTTLYSGLRAINTPALKVLTIEDPVEYEIEGIMQVPVNPVAGLTFASALRSLLRQDPDVIMVGEIRDVETAQIAIQASLTGHLVLSTLHTNDAPASVTRLIDMGVEPFLLASTVEAVLAQRLVRRICPHCRTTHEPSPAILAQLGLDPRAGRGGQFHRGRGCPECGGTGYRGRMGIFEWLVLTEPLRELVAQKAPAAQIRRQAREQGMSSLRDEALRAVLDGRTTIEELLRHT